MVVARSTSAMSVPRPGPASTSRTRLGLPSCSQQETHLGKVRVRVRVGLEVGVGSGLGSQTHAEAHHTPRRSPKICEISGDVTKSPCLPKTSRCM